MMADHGLIVSVRVLVELRAPASVTMTVKELVPTVVGVPEIMPLALSVSPGGSGFESQVGAQT